MEEESQQQPAEPLDAVAIINGNERAKKYVRWLMGQSERKGLTHFIKNIVRPYIAENLSSGKDISQIKYELNNSILPYIKILKDSKYISMSNVSNIAEFISLVENHLTRIKQVGEKEDGTQIVYQYNNGWHWSDVYGYVSLWRLGKLLQAPVGALGQNDYKRVSDEACLILALYDDRNSPVLAVEIKLEDNSVQKIISYNDEKISNARDKAYLIDFLYKNWICYSNIEFGKLLKHEICYWGDELEEKYQSLLKSYDLAGRLVITDEEKNKYNEN